MKAFVTGGTGFLGFNLVKQLVERGWQVRVYDQSNSKRGLLEELGVEFIQGSITEREKLLDSLAPGTHGVFHVAANTSLWGRNNDLQTRDNLQGTLNMLEASRLHGIGRFIYTSSYTVYGFHPEPVTETTPRNGTQSRINYIVSKALAEEQVRLALSNGLDGVILNPANIMGPYDYRNWSQLFILVEQGKLPGAPPGKGTFAPVDDVAAAHISAFHRGRRGENYLLGGIDISYLELIQTIGKHLGKNTPERPTPGWMLTSLARVLDTVSIVTGKEPGVTPEKAKYFSHNLCCNNGKAREELGYRPGNLEEMIGDTAEWLVAEGMLNETG